MCQLHFNVWLFVCSFRLEPEYHFLSQDGFNAARGVEMTEPWNPLNQVPIHEWLTHSHSEEDKCRLRAMGNIVVPYQGCLAGRVLARMEPFLG